MIIKQKQSRRIQKESPALVSTGEQRNAKKMLLKKSTRNNLEKQVRQQTDELRIRDGQLKQGADREKLGADREKLGADREKLAEEKFLQQRGQLKIRSGQVKQGIDREKLGADREKLGADREKLAAEQIYIRTKAMESTLDGIFIIDAKKPNFPVIYANLPFYSITGYSKNEVIGKDYFHLYGSYPDLRIVEEIKQTMSQGKPFHGEMPYFKKNGEKFWSSLRITPIRDTNSVITHYVGVKTDTTLLKKRDLEIEEQREEILHVTRVGKLAEFVSSLAHEISQPLTAILSYAQAAQRIFKGREPELQEILQYIINDDQRATEVIRRLRLLLKKNKPAFEPLDMNTLINDTATLIMTHITVRNKIIKFELDENLPLIHGDRIQLQQVLLNLISNSLEAMEENSDSRELLIKTLRKDSGTILVKVKDSGCGIPAENIKKLFAHFFTSKPDGLGMGLSISRSIVEAHGGRLEAENNPDRGATFYFTVPVGLKNTL